MGIDAHGLNCLMFALNAGPLGKTCTLGRQNIHLSASRLRRLCGNDIPWSGDTFSERMLQSYFGASSVVSIEMPQWGALGPKARNGTSVTIHLAVPNVDEVVAQAVGAGAREKMPVADMFWGDRYGIVVDPFGHEWSIATRIRNMTPDEMVAAGREAMRKGCAEAEKAAQ